ncbi:hypothetical protein THIOM_003376 [Candidatus Thiomargarita nelsonii]|uniref:Uncharacterized protein n=1 Tax=Candidatus Thiomargarita nelsonii TaxID=1003181 RepID=A0A176RYW8_9GAMM|nr:hypothetical protein THIOM_003376 [Candidatus Thiomargarita nelsonii]
MWRRSASLTIITRISRLIANNILRKLAACACSRFSKCMEEILLTPSTNSATFSPNSLTSCSLVMSVSSITSCKRAAHSV